MLWKDSKFNQLYKELEQIADEILPYYDIDKIKWYSVYIWTKEDDANDDDWRNVFDIEEDGIVIYNKDHTIIEEAKPIIEKIQSKIKELSLYVEMVNNEKIIGKF